MSIRCYVQQLVYDKITTDEEIKITIRDKNPIAKAGDDIFDMLLHYGHDFTNDDCVGEIELTLDDWERLENADRKEWKMIKDENPEQYNKMKNEIARYDYVTLVCI